MQRDVCEIVAKRGLFLGVVQRWTFIAVVDDGLPGGKTLRTSEPFISAAFTLQAGKSERRAFDRLLDDLANDGWQATPSAAVRKGDDWWNIQLWRERAPRPAVMDMHPEPSTATA